MSTLWGSLGANPATLSETNAREPIEPVPRWAAERSRETNPATRPDCSTRRLRPRDIRELVGGELDGRYFGVGCITLWVVVEVAALLASTSE